MNQKLWTKEAPSVSIVVSKNAAAAEHYAASELAAYLKKMSGHDFSILSVPKKEESCFYIGKDAATLAGFVPDSDLTADGFQIAPAANGIAICGLHPRGTLFGVYEFLESMLGCLLFTGGRGLPKPEGAGNPSGSDEKSPDNRIPLFQRLSAFRPSLCGKAKDQRAGVSFR